MMRKVTVQYVLFMILFPIVNNAQNWKPIGLSNKTVLVIKVHPTNQNVLVVGVKDGGIYITEDGGVNWKQGWNEKKSVNAIVLDKYKPQVIFAGGTESIIISRNGGNSFRESVKLGEININSIRLIYGSPKTMIVGTSSGIFKSLNWGKTFLPSGLKEEDISDISISEYGPNLKRPIIYVATLGSGVFKSENLGLTWEPINNGLFDLNVYSIVCHTRDPAQLYVGTLEMGIFYSQNQGQSWTMLNNINAGQGVKLMQAIHRETHQTVLYATNFLGNLYRSYDSGKTWEKIVAPKEKVVGMCIGVPDVVPSTIYLGTTNGIYKYEE